MLSIPLGPVALPLVPVLLLAAVWAASWGAERWTRRRLRQEAPQLAGPLAVRAGNLVLVSALIGLLGARLGHVLRHADLFVQHPGMVLDVRDGGWWALTGVPAGLAWLGRGLWRWPALRQPVLGASALSALATAGLAFALGVGRAPAAGLAVELLPLAGGPAQTLRLGEAAARPRVVNLWASWCGPCRQEMPVLAAAQAREVGRVDFLFVNQGESAAAVRAYLTDQGLALGGVWLDAGARLGPAVGSPGLPTTLFYGAGGELLASHFGVLNAVALEARLRELRPAAFPSSSSSSSAPP